MLGDLKYKTEITLDGVPIQWGQKFELYYPDLPGFPTVYVHFLKDSKRVYGFPITANFNDTDERQGSVKLSFISNTDLDSDPSLKEAVKNELENRFGLSNKLSWNDVVSACNGEQSYVDFFRALWIPLSRMHGDFLPYGRFFEEVYSIVRFVSAWNPKTGRQSEMRMLYNFVSIFGEPVTIDQRWNHLDFFLLPTYDDIRSRNFSDFQKFKELYDAMQVIWNEEFTVSTPFNDTTIRSMERSWPHKKEDFMQRVTGTLVSSGSMTDGQKANMDRLVDMFNRNPPRTSFFVWSIMSIKDNDFRSWNKDQFVEFYLETSKGVGISPKVVACFLQQGFGKEEFIPIDTWVGAFHKHALGIEDQKDFFDKFSLLGKLERLIWMSSQANKTNIKSFFDTLWCTRFGNNGNKELRGANPISCYECKLRPACPGYNKIKNEKILVQDSVSQQVFDSADSSDCKFVCMTESCVPKKVYLTLGTGARRRWKLVDEFSGYVLKSQTTQYVGQVTTVETLVNDLPDSSQFNFMEIV